MYLALFCWQSLSDASGIISLQLNFPNIIPFYNVLLMLDITNAYARYTRITNPAKRDFVKKTFDPKLRASARTKGSLGRKNSSF